jgi:hypothetical protein
LNTLVIIGEVFGMHHQLGGSTEDDMNKMSVIGHISPTNMTTMVVPFAPHTAWDLWICPIGRADPLPKGSGGGVVEANNVNR